MVEEVRLAPKKEKKEPQQENVSNNKGIKPMADDHDFEKKVEAPKPAPQQKKK